MTQDKDAADKILDHNRQQLSALMDGELSPDEARFLWRRLQHDESLAQSLSRWQLCGDILRGEVHAPAPEGFARGVAAAIANDPVASAVARPGTGWRPARWGTGLALAASVAVVALFVARQTPELAAPEGASQSTQLVVQGQSDQVQNDQVQAAQVQTIARTTPDASAPIPVTGATPQPRQPDPPGTAADIAAVAAVAALPRRAAARRSRGQSQRAAIRSAAQRSAEPQIAVAASTPAPVTPQPVASTQYPQSQATSQMAVAAVGEPSPTGSPFMPKADTVTTRPWPRALLPAASAGGFNVDYGRQQATGSGFYPFQLHAVPDQVPQAPAAQENNAPTTVEPAANEHAAQDTP